jgi:glucosylglycerol 3-phosphatase
VKLSDQRFSLAHAPLLDALCAQRLLLIQDLDGVCMGLVSDPLQRRLDRAYIEAAARLGDHFRVLTNGEHIGRRGVNALVERAYGNDAAQVREQGRFLPGLGGGGVQRQDRHGVVTHPGVTATELEFLREVPDKARLHLTHLLQAPPYALDPAAVATLLAAAVLDNPASPTVNANGMYLHLHDRPDLRRQLQQDLQRFMDALLAEAAGRQLADSFFVHYAPNLGRGPDGRERLRPATADDVGTTDFQLMLSGAVKEAGVLVLLNDHYHRQTGVYPLGESFNVRRAPRGVAALRALAQASFDPRHMPRLVGVGDTVTADRADGQMLRGGSDRGFLTLIQDLGASFGTDNAVLYVDSSRGEVPRPGLDAAHLQRCMEDPQLPPWAAVRGISDAEDPLRLNFIFPGGHDQYLPFFAALAKRLPDQKR